MFAAGENIKSLAASGELQGLHLRFNNLSQKAQSEYHSIKERLFSVIEACQAKEDQISQQAVANYPELSLTLHSQGSLDLSGFLGRKSYITLNNLQAIDKLKLAQDDKSSLRSYHEQVHALLEV